MLANKQVIIIEGRRDFVQKNASRDDQKADIYLRKKVAKILIQYLCKMPKYLRKMF